MKLNEVLSESPQITIEQFVEMCRKYTEENVSTGTQVGSFTIRNGVIDVRGDVLISPKTSFINGALPYKFGTVTGTFIYPYMIGAKCTSFKNAPDIVGKKFIAQGLAVKSFEHAPRAIGTMAHFSGGFNFQFCEGLSSLVGIADHIEQIHGELCFNGRSVTSGGLGLLNIKGHFNLGVIPIDHPFEQFNIIWKYLGKPEYLYDCQTELIENGFEEYAQL